jgi:hypothetical protein
LLTVVQHMNAGKNILQPTALKNKKNKYEG